MRVLSAIVAALLALAPLAAPAQQGDSLSMGQVRSPILTIDLERLLAETRFGQAINADLRARSDALAAENERLRAALTAEERSLTERRPSMEVDAFRAEAEAFDARVQRIRSEQDAKQQALERAVEEGRETFLNAATPVLAGLMIDSGAGVILERREVFLSASLIDITDEAVAAIDEQLGDGTGPQDGTADPAAPTQLEAAPSETPGPAPDEVPAPSAGSDGGAVLEGQGVPAPPDPGDGG